MSAKHRRMITVEVSEYEFDLINRYALSKGLTKTDLIHCALDCFFRAGGLEQDQIIDDYRREYTKPEPKGG